jgi:hypothetical protein
LISIKLRCGNYGHTDATPNLKNFAASVPDRIALAVAVLIERF